MRVHIEACLMTPDGHYSRDEEAVFHALDGGGLRLDLPAGNGSWIFQTEDLVGLVEMAVSRQVARRKLKERT